MQNKEGSLNLEDEAARELVKDVFKMVGKDLAPVQRFYYDEDYRTDNVERQKELISKGYSLKKPNPISTRDQGKKSGKHS